MENGQGPEVSNVQFIDAHRIEIYWNEDVANANSAGHFKVSQAHKPLEIYSSRDEEEWDKRCIYESGKKRTTLYLTEPVDFFQPAGCFLQITGEISNSAGCSADTTIIYPILKFRPFYTRFTKTPSGILIKSSSDVSERAHEMAADMIETMLSKRPEIARTMVEHSASLAIYGDHEDVYDLPEHRGGADIATRPVEGFGGMPEIPTTSISEKNILRRTAEDDGTRYKNESILAHEFGHAVQLIGINCLDDPSLAQQFIHIYERAKKKGLWPKTYAISNNEEYFATLTTIWFNVMAESADGSWDGTRGPVNTRTELKAYDPEAYQFFSSIYPDRGFDAPWDHAPDRFHLLQEN